ncbi:helix-turn-helix domain-containing protein [Nocardia halotolerans]|uniref:Helix-turn-helix domain-containing protein n=1 Tax=Nocardia halotolerans TaxID=1755878 RepID=A0ABV8VG30_9NOCA
MNGRSELTSFLMSRRARLRPEEVGLTDYGARRRVPGLRREELAQLAGVSVTHYVRLEQGQSRNISTEVLDSVGAALGLTDDEREYLGNLVHPPQNEPGSGPTEVRTDLVHLVNSITLAPAYVTGRYGNILTWNPMTATVLYDFARVPPMSRTWTHPLFLDAEFRAMFSAADWLEVARYQVAFTRIAWSRHPGDPALAAHLASLREHSAEFCALWDEHRVGQWPPHRVRLAHPVLGQLELAIEMMQPGESRDQTFVAFVVAPDSPTESALRRHATRSAGDWSILG